MNDAMVENDQFGLVSGICPTHLGDHHICVNVIETELRSIGAGDELFFEPEMEDMKEGLKGRISRKG